MESKKSYLMVGIIAIVAVLSISIFAMGTPTSENSGLSNNLGGVIDGYVTMKFYDASEDTWTILLDNKHNIFTEGGKNFTMEEVGGIGSPSNMSANWIGLGNGTYAPSEAHNQADWLAIDYTNGSDSCNLSRHQCTTSKIAKGQWNCTYTFVANETATGVSHVGILTNHTGGYLVAEANFTKVTLEAADQLQATWNFTVS